MTLPTWVEITSALSTPAIAIVGSVIAYQNHQLEKKSRKDELFDRRYAFYKNCRSWWLDTWHYKNSDPPPEVTLFTDDIEQLTAIAQEAEFLFGKDIYDHILSLYRQTHDGSPEFPHSGFIEPFAKYLRLEER